LVIFPFLLIFVLLVFLVDYHSLIEITI
jgi:hypothetical protein